jgi:sterol O-acyltransferase
VLHGIVMLMKQHSYAFYNGYLSSVYKDRQGLLVKLKQLENISPITAPSPTIPSASSLSIAHLTHQPSAAEYRERRLSLSKSRAKDPSDMERISEAIDSRKPLDMAQVQVFEGLIKWEIDALADELKGKATESSRFYPNNLNLANHYEYIILPTLVYELQYPRAETINWFYVAEKAAAMVGVIFVMLMVSQEYIYPVYIRTVLMKESGWTLAQRFQEFPWLLSDLLFPFMMEYLVRMLSS